MVLAFDTLGYAKRLRDDGVLEPQAEAHAEAARDYIMVELVTKRDLAAAIDRVDGMFEALRTEMELRFKHLDSRIDSLRNDVDAKIERLSLQLTIRLGALMVAGLGALAVILRLH
ncbi:hypothetical protein CCR97_24760 [Rhodoplanes elegans]|uniref:DUF1640 domain-containing protein n=1 Tax=Rhodoplanes elegans TaxID=29408 RepID=A0A327K8U9_9BRAD|nr:hypothetical protein [Rhodoplanes elegans]MBK5961392.1 hypothetical protein [Rhodoplanes elegans]RAI34143.1 hypothetical protein CH338_21415 [Rhodoplanes elegans]